MLALVAMAAIFFLHCASLIMSIGLVIKSEPVLTVISDFCAKNKALIHCEQEVIEFEGTNNLREIPHLLMSIRAKYPEILEAEEQSYIEFQRVLPDLIAIMDEINRVINDEERA